MERARRYAATEALGAVLEEQGRKRRWLAERIGVTESWLSHVLAGRHTVDRDQGERIAGILGVPFFVLFVLRAASDSDSPPEEAA